MVIRPLGISWPESGKARQSAEERDRGSASGGIFKAGGARCHRFPAVIGVT